MTTARELEGMIIPESPVSTASRFSYGYFTEDYRAGCTILDGDTEIARIPTRFPSLAGSNIVGALYGVESPRIQVSDHGAGRHTVQIFDGSKMIRDEIV